ncbi:MAG: hypothetical protein GX294_02910 [Candidatus Cloacimonetes bacterium]|nr:hypothetical protein [Candidatus Cloacimonadota bacterium]
MWQSRLFSAFLLALGLLMMAACASTGSNVFPLERGYLKEELLYGNLKAIAAINPGLVKVRLIGFGSGSETPIYALEIGDPKAKGRVLIIGQHHGEEVLGIELSVALAHTLAQEWKRHKQWSKILEEYQIWIVPTINPEGWRAVSSGELARKRKNNRVTNKNKTFDIRTDGVDLNRNYPVFWADQVPVPHTHPNYKGERPATEPEVQAIISLAEKQDFELAFFYHSSASGNYSETIYLPAWVQSDAVQEARINSLMDFAKGYAILVKRDYQDGYYHVAEGNSSRVGNARNYFFHTHDTDALLIEIGGINQEGISVIHPPVRMMRKIVDKNINALRSVLYERALERGQE